MLLEVIRAGLLLVAPVLMSPNTPRAMTDSQVLALGRMAAKSEMAWGQRPEGFEFVLDNLLVGTPTRARSWTYNSGNCVIGVSPEFWDEELENDTQRQTLVTHEWGHCLGIGHLDSAYGESIMALTSSTVTELDRAALRRLHGIKIGMVSTE